MRRRRPAWTCALLLSTLVWLQSCSAAEAPSGAPRLGSRPIETGEITLIPKVPSVRYQAGLVLSSDDPRFGGFSGLWLGSSGTKMVAVSDRPSVWTFGLDFDADGRLMSVDALNIAVPEALGGHWDAEALASLPSGAIAIAHEQNHRVERRSWDRLDLLNSEPLPEVLASSENAGVEALATMPDGSLLALAEGSRSEDGGLRGWILKDGKAEELTYTTIGRYVPTGATVVGDHLLVVERSFSLVQGGFAARVVAFPVSEVVPGTRLESQEVLRLGANHMDNFEAITASVDPEGRLVILLLTDDNQFAVQRTLLLQLSMDPEDLA